jgi:transposase InsO family protein
MDFVTGLPPVLHGGREVDAILVIVDRLTKYVLFFPVSSTVTAPELVELFHNEVELKYGAPAGIVSDRGSVFTSQFWTDLCYISRVKLRLSTAFHPQTDGQTERMNQILGHYLRCFIGDNQAMWPKLLRSAEYACNSVTSTTTGVTPQEALMGYQPNFQIRTEDSALEGGVPEARARAQRLRELREKLTRHWEHVVERQRKYHEQHHIPMEFFVGQRVLLSTKNL